MRKDLGMRAGKMVAQGSHASLGALFSIGKKVEGNPHPFFQIPLWTDVYQWVMGSFTKVCVRVDSEEELIELYRAARNANMPAALITDAGHTEFNGVPTNTCVGIGPARSEDIDKITGHLKLL